MDIVLSDPVAECPTLYRYARFLDKHPIRVCIPLVPGFRKPVVVAAALQFAVKLETPYYDHTVNFAKYKTFMWIREPEPKEPFMKDRIVGSITAQMLDKFPRKFLPADHRRKISALLLDVRSVPGRVSLHVHFAAVPSTLPLR